MHIDHIPFHSIANPNKLLSSLITILTFPEKKETEIMAFSKKRARSLDSDEAEEAHPKIEIDLNKEPEDEDEDEADLNEEVEMDEEAHPKKEIDLNKQPEDEDEDEDANQHQEHDHERNLDKEREEQDEIVTASFAISHMAFIRDITQDENQRNVEPETETNEDDDDQEEEEEASSDETDLENKEADEDQDDVDHQAKEEVDLDRILASVVRRKRTESYEIKEEPKNQDEDDSEQTLSLLCRWEMPATPPDKIIYGGLVEQCSRPIRKQLKESDVSVEEEISRLTLAKSQVTKKFLPLLEESKIRSAKDGIKVSCMDQTGRFMR